MKLLALSDLHVGFEENREALETLGAHPDDGLILGGDLGETIEHLEIVLEIATERFARVLWVSGNHELWTHPHDGLRGVAKYKALVQLCRDFDVITPEDPFVVWEGEGGPCALALLFLLYDYSFRPDDVAAEDALDWAAAAGIMCADERYLHPEPHASRQAWCSERCDAAEARLSAAAAQHPLVIINHFSLREELVRLWRIPRFSLWCGTKRTEDWHRRFRAKVVVYGHLHMRATDWIDGVRFEEVSLGYPKHWRVEDGMDAYLREILPGPSAT